jgi:Icc-related predicted phosphoesterase
MPPFGRRAFVNLLCLADIHGEGAGLKDVLLRDALGVDLVVVAGDLTHLGGHAEAEAILAPLLAPGIPLVAVGGNMDRDGARRCLDEKGINIHGRGIVLEGVGFMGLGGGTPSPFGTPWEITELEAGRILASGLPGIAQATYKVLVSHAPPRGTRLDRSFTGLHVGSEAVREFLLAGAVDLCICGHIHESAGEDTLGRTHCVNIGPFKNGSYALIGIDSAGAQVTWRKV